MLLTQKWMVILLSPRDHFEQIADLREEQAEELMRWIWKCCTAIQKIYSPKKIYVFSFNEHKDYHLHVHIKPKLQTIPDEVRGPCFVDYSDPFLKELRDAVEDEQEDSKRVTLKNKLDEHNKEEIRKIRNEIDKLKNYQKIQT